MSETDAMRPCAHCGRPLPADSRVDARFHPRCRVAALRARKRAPKALQPVAADLLRSGVTDIDLRLGDCFAGLAELPDRSVDHVLTDPPFDERTHAHARAVSVGGGKRRMCGALSFTALDHGALLQLAGHFSRLARRWIVVFAAERQLEPWAQALEAHGAKVIHFLPAMRTNPAPQFSGDRPSMPCDYLVLAHAAGIGAESMRWNAGGKAGVWSSPPARLDPGGQVHETQKPLPLMRALLNDLAEPGELVLDPFAGSGTTAVACHELGRRFLGWEREPRYHAAALARLRRIQAQGTLALGTPKPRQAKLALVGG